MKLLTRLLSLFLVMASSRAEPVALVGGTVINPRDGRIIPNAVVIVDGERIAAVGTKAETKVPEGARTVDCAGKFILPGYIDTHVHFFQSGGLFTRPDAIDLTAVRPYRDEIAGLKASLTDTFARYLRSGITSVLDIGGPFWNFEVRKAAAKTEKAPRVAVAGPLISSVARPQLDLGDPPIVKIASPEEGVAFVGKLAAQKPDYIKIWYVVTPDSPLEKFRPVVSAVIKESHRRKLRVAVHATELETARAAVEDDADLLVHSVTDAPVDEAFIKLMQTRGTILTPTLVVFERYGQTFANKLALTPEEKAWGNPEVLATLDVTKLPADKRPERIRVALEDPAPVQTRIAQTHAVAFQNLKKLADANIPIATGTDAGNIGTIHGPAIFREFALMREAGLSPMQILRSTTAIAARAFGGEVGAKLGAIEPGHYADMVILSANPLDDIAHASKIESVMKGGVLHAAGTILPAASPAPGP